MAVPALDHHTADYQLPLVYWLAKAAALAYKDDTEIRETAGGYIDSDGRLHHSMSVVGGLGDRAKGFAGNPLAPGTDALADHYVNHYLDRLEKACG